MTSTKPTIATVARAAGVSAASVSNAYNRPEQLSAVVRARILAAARELGYAGPDPAARSLRSRRTGAIGVLFTSGLSYGFSDPYCVELLRGVSEIAEGARVSLLLIPLTGQSAGLDEQAVREAVIDGAIADGIAAEHPALGVLRARGLPLVRSVDEAEARCVVLDEEAAGRQVGEHLAALGHRDVAVLVEGDSAYARLRLAGIRAGLGAEVTVVDAGANTPAAARAAAGRVLGAPGRPSAIAAVSDALAFGVLEAARERGLRPGVGLSVTGFDDVAAAAQAGLTTVSQPIAEKGRVMGRMLLDPAFADRRVVLPTALVIRASTGPAA